MLIIMLKKTISFQASDFSRNGHYWCSQSYRTWSQSGNETRSRTKSRASFDESERGSVCWS